MKKTLLIILSSLLLAIIFIFFNVGISLADEAWKISRITSDKARIEGTPQLIAGSQEYGLVWVDNRNSDTDLYFSRINNKGKGVGREIQITNNDVHDLTPSMVWNGSDYGLFWSYDKSSIFFIRINERGKKIINDTSIGVQSRGYAIHVSAVWNGQEYGVTWWDVRDAPACNPSGTRGRAFFARVNNNGEMIGSEIPVSDAFSNPWQDYHPLMVWDGENYAIFWGDSRENGECAGGIGDIYMAKVNRNGEKILGDIKLQSNELSPQLWDVEWDGENYVIGYNGRIGMGHLAKMDTNGNTIMVDMPINPDNHGGSPMITSHDNQYYISWGDFRDRTAETFYNTEIYYTITDKDGNKLIPETRLTNDLASSGQNTPFIFLNGKPSVAWIDSQDGFQYINLAIQETLRRTPRPRPSRDR